jgi:dihydroneopterin aldolase
VEEETPEELKYREWYDAKKEYQSYLDTTHQFVSEPQLQLIEKERKDVLSQLEEAYKVLDCMDVTTEEYRLCLAEIEHRMNPYLLKFKDCVYS